MAQRRALSGAGAHDRVLPVPRYQMGGDFMVMKVKTRSGSKYLIDGDRFQRLSEIPLAAWGGGPDRPAPCGTQGRVVYPHLVVEGGVVLGVCDCCERQLTSTQIVELVDG